MKKLVSLITFLAIMFFSVNSHTQQQMRSPSGKFYPQPGTVPVMNVTINTIQNGWAQIGSACGGCSSFFYQITRTQQAYQAEDGIYYFFFYFYFFSNSYYPNGSVGATYLTGVTFIADGMTLVQTPYLLLEAGNQKFGAWIRTRNPNSGISFNVAKMTVF